MFRHSNTSLRAHRSGCKVSSSDLSSIFLSRMAALTRFRMLHNTPDPAKFGSCLLSMCIDAPETTKRILFPQVCKLLKVRKTWPCQPPCFSAGALLLLQGFFLCCILGFWSIRRTLVRFTLRWTSFPEFLRGVTYLLRIGRAI